MNYAYVFSSLTPLHGPRRSEMWLKLWGSVAFNPISALTHATLVDLCTFPETKALSIAMMTEAQEIARRVGSEMRVPLEKRLNGAAAVWHGPAARYSYCTDCLGEHLGPRPSSWSGFKERARTDVLLST
jgi:ketopantoate reductase